MAQNKSLEEWSGRVDREGFMFEAEFEHILEEESRLWLFEDMVWGVLM